MTNIMQSLLSSVLSFIGVLIIFLTLAYKLKKGTHKRDREWEEFIESEHEASFCTQKTFPSSLLWTIDFDKIPVVDHLACNVAYKKFLRFENLPLADLRDYSNLELKKQFGINHLDALIRSEQSYLECMNVLVHYGVCLKEAGFITESITTLEYTLEKGCDKKDCYLSLIDMYVIIKDRQKLLTLKERIDTCAHDLVYLDAINQALDKALHLNL